MEHIHDVVVVGAGPGGAAAAHYLAMAGLDVMVLDRADFPRDKTCGDGLTPRALKALADMGILEETEQAGQRINGLAFFGQRGASLAASVPDHAELPNHLLVVPRVKLDDIVRRRAVLSGAGFRSPVKVNGWRVEEDQVTVLAEQGGHALRYQARALVLAVGANMGLLQSSGMFKRLPRPIVAARGYYEEIQDLDERLQVHFEDVPMPGYGWIFPISKDAANVGLGMWRDMSHDHSPIRAALDVFLKGRIVKQKLAGAKLAGAVKSYPIRIDFATAPTHAERVLLVGEAAGLVSPLTGEGIDFALESGKLAAEFLVSALASGNFSRLRFVQYERVLRAHFQSTFRALSAMRHVYVNPLLMDRALKLCEKDARVKEMLVSVVLSQEHPLQMLKPQILRKVLLGV
jgi:geranylgeranyl reductase family protein